MILELKIRNFLSFKDEVTFSFEATSDTTLDEYYVAEPAPGVRVLKMAMVYGANASGKSNLLKAFDFIRHFVLNIPKERDNKTRFIPFKFDVTKNEPGNFEITFLRKIKNISIYYSLIKTKFTRRNYFIIQERSQQLSLKGTLIK